MSERKWFYRYGRCCPQDCPEVCCVICTYSDGAIEFTPTRPVIHCNHKEVEKNPDYKKDRGLDCPHFSKKVVPSDVLMTKEEMEARLR